MRAELQLAGLSERTQEAYLRAVRQLAAGDGRTTLQYLAAYVLASPRGRNSLIVAEAMMLTFLGR